MKKVVFVTLAVLVTATQFGCNVFSALNVTATVASVLQALNVVP